MTRLLALKQPMVLAHVGIGLSFLVTAQPLELLLCSMMLMAKTPPLA
jgi:hypothetical protein